MRLEESRLRLQRQQFALRQQNKRVSNLQAIKGGDRTLRRSAAQADSETSQSRRVQQNLGMVSSKSAHSKQERTAPYLSSQQKQLLKEQI